MSRSKTNCSVVLTVFNEERHIVQCIESLLKQRLEGLEIIVVDDASTDRTYDLVASFCKNKQLHKKISLYKLSHRGPGECRNFGAKKANGNILIFLDGDMYFAEDFIEKLIYPILKNPEIIGTDSQSEFLANPENFWAKCWNIGRFVSVGNFSHEYMVSMVPDKRNFGGVFRAIRKADFFNVAGFERGGDYSDDETLGKKIGIKATLSNDAFFYHFNPDSFYDVWQRSSWIGKDQKLNRGINKYINLIRFSFPFSFVKGILIGIKMGYPPFILFKIVFDAAVWLSVMSSL
jgi:glycosyltransferase involved in cell wall biosynthesis